MQCDETLVDCHSTLSNPQSPLNPQRTEEEEDAFVPEHDDREKAERFL